MKYKIYQVDAFTDHLFSGNPAAVCPLESWLPDQAMQNIAMENNLSETAFFVKIEDHYHIRWFTPAVEVDLCGHATLASAHVIFEFLGFDKPEIRFTSRSGWLHVRKDRGLLILNFPADEMHPVDPPSAIIEALKVKPIETYKGKTDYMFVLDSEQAVLSADPDFTLLRHVECRGIIITARGQSVDFVSRFFAPKSGVDEDPVTGSAHTSLTPYWADRYGKQDLNALQLSKRRGILYCKYLGDRVEISGHAITYLTGEIYC